MSIVIKGVNAPNNCYDCINSSDGEPFELLSNCRTFGDLCEGKITVDELPKDKRNDSCPVKQLPTPHGRLIDTDELLKKLERHRDMCGDIETQYGIDTAIRILRNIPTIIETEA